MFEYIIYGLLGLLAIFILVILIRTLMFVPKKEEERKVEEVKIDGERAIKSLQRLLQFKTISYEDSSKEDDSEFEGLVNELPKLFPNVYRVCELKKFDGRALLFKFKGKEKGDPAVLMAHYDVVPIEEKEWTKPAFDGLIEDGILWGRGALDTKVTFNGVLSAAENLIEQGFTPKHDIYFAFSGGEEISGPGAVNIVNYFKKNNITPAYVIDEGGAVVREVFPGVKESCGLIGIAEKGLVNFKFECKSNGGHASSPKPHTPVGKLSMACAKVEAHPFPKHYTKPVLEMFDALGRRSSFVYRMIFANLWCFGGLLDSICKKSGGTLNALVRTTVAFTQMQGSKAPNVIPPTAHMVANLRLNPCDTKDSALEYIKNIINDEDIKVSYIEGDNPSPISSTSCAGWNIIKNAVSDTWKGAVVAPYLMVQASDSRQYAEISDRVYKFSAMDMSNEEIATIHGNDEHIRLDALKRSVEFFYRVMKES